MTTEAADVADASISSPKPGPRPVRWAPTDHFRRAPTDHFRRAPTDLFRRAPTDLLFSFADRALIERLWTERAEPGWLRAERMAAADAF